MQSFDNKMNNGNNVLNGIENVYSEIPRSPSPTQELPFYADTRINSNSNQNSLIDNNGSGIFDYSFSNDDKLILPPILKENVNNSNNNINPTEKKVVRNKFLVN